MRAGNPETRAQSVADLRAQQTSRRGFLLAGALALGAETLLAPQTASAAKLAKAQAGYKDSPRAGARCDKCLQFQPPAACKLVDGAVSPSGSCNLFAPRPS